MAKNIERIAWRDVGSIWGIVILVRVLVRRRMSTIPGLAQGAMERGRLRLGRVLEIGIIQHGVRLARGIQDGSLLGGIGALRVGVGGLLGTT